METKNTSKNTSLNKERTFTTYAATRNVCRASHKSIFGSSRRYC